MNKKIIFLIFIVLIITLTIDTVMISSMTMDKSKVEIDNENLPSPLFQLRTQQAIKGNILIKTTYVGRDNTQSYIIAPRIVDNNAPIFTVGPICFIILHVLELSYYLHRDIGSAFEKDLPAYTADCSKIDSPCWTKPQYCDNCRPHIPDSVNPLAINPYDCNWQGSSMTGVCYDCDTPQTVLDPCTTKIYGCG
ncbi:MAG TPA: hypothetical protein ENI51_05285 [Candidatus Atribacteria bacterium]|nr:hypothetical protein [Candidatus Atribacteria bacterium]